MPVSRGSARTFRLLNSSAVTVIGSTFGDNWQSDSPYACDHNGIGDLFWKGSRVELEAMVNRALSSLVARKHQALDIVLRCAVVIGFGADFFANAGPMLL
jgi:hypothetical protein